MNYNSFRMAWQEALAGAGLRIWGFTDETIVLRNMARAYRTYVSRGGLPPPHAFNVTAELNWEWDALLSARSETVEEDMLMQVLGEDRRDEPTELPWLRVNGVSSLSTRHGLRAGARPLRAHRLRPHRPGC